MITINVPLTVLLSFYEDEDPVYYLVIILMVAVKIFMSALSAKIRMYLINPRYNQNKQKILKEKWRYHGDLDSPSKDETTPDDQPTRVSYGVNDSDGGSMVSGGFRAESIVSITD